MTLGPIGHRITTKLAECFAPASLEVIDESGQHAGHAGARDSGASHFRVRIVAEAFRGKSRVEQHRMVNAALAKELRDDVHALAIQASAPDASEALRFVALHASDARLLQLLAATGLSDAALDAPGLHLVGIASPADEILACGGLSMYGDAAMIRSVAVAQRRSRQGLGTALTFKLLAEARNRGAQAAYLLTDSAPAFFARLGFAAVDRARVPAVVAADPGFSATRCAAAQPMVCPLRPQ